MRKNTVYSETTVTHLARPPFTAKSRPDLFDKGFLDGAYSMNMISGLAGLRRIGALTLLLTLLAGASPVSADVFDVAATCDADALRKEIAAGGDPAASDEKGNTVLHWAARNSGAACVEVLLEHKDRLNLDARNTDGETALMKAAISSTSEEGALSAARMLIEAGADATIPNKFGYSPLFALLVYGNGMMMAMDPAYVKPDPQTGIPPYKGIEYGMAKLLLENDADPNEVDRDGKSAMHMAVALRTPAVIDLLVQHGGDLQYKEPENDRSLLHIAAQWDRVINLPYLLKNGLDINGSDKKDGTPLMMAVANQNKNAAEALIAAGADIEKGDFRGSTPLIYVTTQKMLEMVVLLLDNGADINARAGKGNTSLHEAAYQGWSEGVIMLLGRGANPKMKDITNLTAADYARQSGEDDIAKLLDSRQ